MSRNKGRLLIALVAVLLLSGALATNISAVSFNKMLDARYKDIKILHNGQRINIETAYEPFIVYIEGNPTTFVPLRALGEMLDKEVIWNQDNYSVNIQDKLNLHVISLSQELVLRNEEIKSLKEEVAGLKKDLERGRMVTFDELDELERYLNREFGYYEKIDFDIEVSASRKDIDVNILVDLNRDYARWYSLSETKIKSYIDDIVKKIRYNFKDAYVTGYIEDKRTGKLLADFYTGSSGKPVISFEKSYTGTLESLESYLNNRFASDYSWSKLDFEIELKKSGDKITVYVDINSSDWKGLSSSNRKRFLEDIYGEILRNYWDASVEGYIYYYSNKSSFQYRFDFNKYDEADIW